MAVFPVNWCTFPERLPGLSSIPLCRSMLLPSFSPQMLSIRSGEQIRLLPLKSRLLGVSAQVLPFRMLSYFPVYSASHTVLVLLHNRFRFPMCPPVFRIAPQCGARKGRDKAPPFSLVLFFYRNANHGNWHPGPSVVYYYRPQVRRVALCYFFDNFIVGHCGPWRTSNDKQ